MACSKAISEGTTIPKSGIMFVEARIRDNVDLSADETKWIQDALEDLLSSPSQTFDLGEDILANQNRALLLLGHSHEAVERKVHSLKVVDYSGPKMGAICHSSDEVRIKVQTYKLYKTAESSEGLHQAEITPMPHIKFDRQWNELVFEKDFKGGLIRLMENMLRFSRNPEKRPELNPLILIHGPPGTGKTALAQGLAQKISIRLNRTFKRTKFIQIKTAAILSRFYSQSARQVSDIFTAIEEICDEDREQFVCILIDEVECIASSRESSMHGEVQDSLRVTNALLTGLDRTKTHSNIVLLCTSNMPDCLDSAFIDRCGIKLEVDFPRPPAQYEILRGRVQSLINNRHIVTNTSIPPYRDAKLEFDAEKTLPGSRLLGIVALINSVDSASSERNISGRTLAQLPGKAILCYLEDDECDLESAFRFMEKSILAENEQGMQKRGSETKDMTQVEREYIGLPGQKEGNERVSKHGWDVDRVLRSPCSHRN